MLGISKSLEATLLSPIASKEDILALCQQAHLNNCLGVCLPPYHVKEAAIYLKKIKSDLKLVTVVGFPMGFHTVSAKVEEVKKAIMNGAHELDVVLNLAAFVSGDFTTLKNDLESMLMAAHSKGCKVKAIVESGAFKTDDLIRLTDLAVEAGTDYIKTSTGYFAQGATPQTIELLRKHLPDKIGLKASGGIKTFEAAKQMLNAGANIIGTSSPFDIINQEKP